MAIVPRRLLDVPVSIEPNADIVRYANRTGIPIDRIIHDKSFLSHAHGGSPRSLGFRFREGTVGRLQRITVSGGLPQCDNDSYELIPKWGKVGDSYVSEHNLFRAEVKGTNVLQTVLCDQPDGRRVGDTVRYNPELFLDNVPAPPVSPEPTLIDDPLNPKFTDNTLRWDYECFYRYMRLVSGKCHSWWAEKEDPKRVIRVEYNQRSSGSKLFRLKLSRYAITNDIEEVSIEQYLRAKHRGEIPFSLGDSTAFNPDAHVETTCFDGDAMHEEAAGLSWVNMRAAAGNWSTDDTFAVNLSYLVDMHNDNNCDHLRTMISLFDTSAINDAHLPSAATFEVFAYNEVEADTRDPRDSLILCITNPNSNTAVADGDYAYARWGAQAADAGVSINGWDIDDYQLWTLNAAGLSEIDVAGVSKYGLRYSYDFLYGSLGAPSLDKTKRETYMYMYLSDNGSNEPKLTVTHSEAASAFIVSSNAAKLLSGGAL